ncbi:MAG: FAD-dependent oxidoreductase [Ferruginibacter sp.]
MQQKISLRLLPSEAADEITVKRKIAEACSKKQSAISGFHILKRSIDARGKNVLINLTLTAFIDEPFHERELKNISFKDTTNASKKVIIIGAGPAGLFAALKLLEAGILPIILERGKDVKSRRRDLALLNREGIVNPESNYCFGEGGAGTYSDGKLYTRSNKRGDIDRILNLFVQFGAPSTILFDAHPHIGTNKLPGIITAMRNAIRDHGGKVLFEKKVVDIECKGDKIVSVKTADGDVHVADAYILATGHSARDIFELLHKKKIQIEAKPFALGVRVEHPQSFIDSVQYHSAIKNELLPPASYSLVEQVNGKGVFSFCMCPGGIIAPASTSPGEIVVNGWSPSKRNNPFANSGMVVTISPQDAFMATKHLKIKEDDPLLFMHFQKMVEQKAFEAGGGNMAAPAQRMVDFSDRKISASLPSNSYLPGLNPTDLQHVLPAFVYDVLAKGFKAFGKKMKGYYTNDANVVATESRTSSPVRIPRNTDTYEHPQYQNLYPCGEGAGYAGGIVSAAMDGENVAAQLIWKLSDLKI